MNEGLLMGLDTIAAAWPAILLIVVIATAVGAWFFIGKKEPPRPGNSPAPEAPQEELRKRRELMELREQSARLLSLEPYMHTLNEYSDCYCLLFGLQRERRDNEVFRKHLLTEFVPMANIEGLSSAGFDLKPLRTPESKNDSRDLTLSQMEQQIDEQRDILQRFQRYHLAKKALEATGADLYRIVAAVASGRIDVPQIRADISAIREKFEHCGIYPKYYEEFLDDPGNRRRFYKIEKSQTDRPALFMRSGPDRYLLIGKEGWVKGDGK